MTSEPTIDVVIPTCNRPADLQRCLARLAEVRYSSWTVLVVDQSDDDASEGVVREVGDCLPHLTYRHVGWKGASRARNLGMREAAGEIVAFLDDDCTVEPNWLQNLAAVFARYPDAGLVCGQVTAAPHDPDLYYIPTCDLAEERILSRPREFLRAEGISAAMYLRRSFLDRIGPFDEYLGPGAHFPGGGEDRDYIYRVLVAGLAVVETPEVGVQHYGMRSYTAAGVRQLFWAYDYSQGAMDMKLLRCGDLTAFMLTAARIGKFVAALDLPQFILRQRPTRLGRLLAYLSGLRASFQIPVDRAHCLYGDGMVLATEQATVGAVPTKREVG